MDIVKRLRGNEGFTLVEAMISMFFVAYMVTQMAMLSTYAKRTTNLSQRITRANMLADEAIEKSRNRSYNNLQLAIADLGETCAPAPVVTLATCTSTIDGIFTRVRTIKPLDTNNPPNVISLAASNKADIEAEVTFVDARGDSQVVRVATVVTRF